MEIFVWATNDPQLLTVVTKNFIPDTTTVLDSRDKLNQTLNKLKTSPSQSSDQALYPLRFSCTKQHNKVRIALSRELF